MIDDDIRDQEERFHVEPSTLAWLQGYREGRASVAAEITEMLAYLDNIAEAWGDDDQFRTARDRLRALL